MAEELRRLLTRGDVEEVLSRVQSDLPGQPGNATRRNNLSGARVYLRWLKDTGRSPLTPEEGCGAAYLAFLREKHPDTPASVINRLAHARNLYAALSKGGLALPDPFASLDAPSNDPALHKEAYTEAEVARLINHGGKQVRALVLLGAHAGLTGPEVVSLEFSDLTLSQGVLQVRGRSVPTSQELQAALEAYALTQGVSQLFGGSGPVFPDIKTDHQLRAVLFAACARANVPYRAWRPLRNHAGLRLLQLTHDEEYVARYLGLSTLKAVKFIMRAVERGMGQEWRPTAGSAR